MTVQAKGQKKQARAVNSTRIAGIYKNSRERALDVLFYFIF